MMIRMTTIAAGGISTVDDRFRISVVDGEAVVGEGVGFERIRRITGYLVGTLDRFNNGKRAEEADRLKHAVE